MRPSKIAVAQQIARQRFLTPALLLQQQFAPVLLLRQQPRVAFAAPSRYGSC
jgi:hypothetical protein